MTASSAPRGPRRLWMPAGLLGLAALYVGYSWMDPELEDKFQIMRTFSAVALCLLLLPVWLLFFSGLRWRTRLASLGAGVLVLAGLVTAAIFLLRFDGQSGNAIPRFVWAWTPAHAGDRALPMLNVLAEPGQSKADLYSVSPTDYPQFLGRERLGVVRGVYLERDWKAKPPREVWRQPIGAGFSAFAVVGGHAVTQEQRGDQELTVCYDVATGKPLWTHANPVRFTDKTGDGPRATPTIDNGRVYVQGATGILDCLDGATGKAIWSRDVLKENKLPNLEWAKSNSPLIVDDLVIVTGGNADGPSLLAYKKDSGDLAWKAGSDKASYSSPVLATLAGRRQIIMLNANSVTGHDPTDGTVLWDYPWPAMWPKVTQPIAVGGDHLLISTGYGLGTALLEIKPSSDGKQTATELWKNLNLKPQFANNVVRDGYVYGLDDGTLCCLDLETGKRKWKAGRYRHGQVLLVEDLLVVLAEEPGDVVLVEANPEKHIELGRIRALEAKTWSSPVLAGRYLLVRNDREAVCYEVALRADAGSTKETEK